MGEAPSHLWRTRTADVAPHADVIHAPEGTKIPWGERWRLLFPAPDSPPLVGRVGQVHNHRTGGLKRTGRTPGGWDPAYVV